jgi:rfaE bifunctional protein nucleotidyltransferase chain/domain
VKTDKPQEKRSNACTGEPSRVISRADLGDLSSRAKADGKRLVATNGCFDILHAGHVRYLEAASQLGDILIVGLNSDESVRRLKGPTRPVNSESDRAEVLLALRCVDYVTIFGEETAIEFLKLLQPNVYVKGGDWTPGTLPETPVVESCGGKIMIIELVPGKSTSSTIAKIRSGE